MGASITLLVGWLGHDFIPNRCPCPVAVSVQLVTGGEALPGVCRCPNNLHSNPNNLRNSPSNLHNSPNNPCNCPNNLRNSLGNHPHRCPNRLVRPVVLGTTTLGQPAAMGPSSFPCTEALPSSPKSQEPVQGHLNF